MRFLRTTALLAISISVILAGSFRAEARRLVETLPKVSYSVDGYSSPDSVRQRMRALDLHRVEGMWRFPSDGATIAIERYVPDGYINNNELTHYRLVILRSPQRALRPGTVMGHLAPTAKPGVYKASIYTASDGGRRLLLPHTFTLTLVDDGHLTFKRDGNPLRLSINAWRMIPYLSTMSVRLRSVDTGASDLDGCVRIFPAPLSGPIEPRYL